VTEQFLPQDKPRLFFSMTGYWSDLSIIKSWCST